MRKWAVEGLSYLTLDADVKEELIEDKKAIQALIELTKVSIFIKLFWIIYFLYIAAFNKCSILYSEITLTIVFLS